MTAAAAVEQLRASLATAYPAYLAERSTRLGAVTCIVTPSRGDYDPAAACDPLPLELSADIDVLAAGTGRQAVADLLTHVEPVEALIIAAGWAPRNFTAEAYDDVPAIRFTATAPRT